MSSTGETINGQGQSLRLLFEAGTLIVEGIAADAEPNLPGVKYDIRTRQFRAEAIWYRTIVEHIRKNKQPYTDAARAYEPSPWRLQVAKEAFPHQVEGLKAWWDAGGRGVVVLPTGTGKTHLANMAIERVGRPTLVITPTIDLMNQWYDELALSFGVEVGLLGGGYYDIQPLTVTTYDSAYLNMDRLGNRFGFIVFDECHHLPGPTYGLAATCAIAPYRLGLTATPERADNAHTHLDQLIGPIVYRREITQLRGDYLAEYRAMILYVQLSDQDRLRYEQAREIYRGFVQQAGINMSKPNGWGQFIFLAHRSPEGREAFRAYREQRELALAAPAKLNLLARLARTPQRRPRVDLHSRQRDRLQDRAAVSGARHHAPDQDQGTARDPAAVQRRDLSDRRHVARLERRRQRPRGQCRDRALRLGLGARARAAARAHPPQVGRQGSDALRGHHSGHRRRVYFQPAAAARCV